MTPRQRLFRAVRWALGLSLFTLAFVMFGFCLCQPATTTVLYSSAAMKAGQETRPPPDAPEQEWDEWNERQKPVRAAAYNTAGNTIKASAFILGLPLAVLLTVVCILLYRVLVLLRRGA